jgi:ribosomal protein S18 acetylase RimI-like enzyme
MMHRREAAGAAIKLCARCASAIPKKLTKEAIMISLRPMRAEEFAAYRDYFIPDYAEEIALNFGYSAEKSRAVAAQELADDLPAAVATPGHVLLCIERHEELVGYLWYALRDHGTSAFIFDFVIFEPYRGMGYGKESLQSLETQLAQQGIAQTKLRVAAANKRALALYQQAGFSITGYNMVKALKA